MYPISFLYGVGYEKEWARIARNIIIQEYITPNIHPGTGEGIVTTTRYCSARKTLRVEKYSQWRQ